MSDEEVTTVEEEPATESEATDLAAAAVNPVFDALFKTVEAEDEAEEQPEPLEQPASLHEALYDLEVNAGESAQGETADEPEAEPADAPAVKAKQPKPKVKVKPNVVDPEFGPAPSPRKAPIPQQPDDPFVSELNEEEAERYKLAKWAAKNVKGQQTLDKDYLKFFKDHKEYINKRLEDNPNHELAEDDEYKRFVEQSRPKVSIKELEREKWTQQAEARTMQKMAPEINRLRREQTKIKNTPLARSGMQNAKKLMVEAVPEHMRKELSENAAEYAKRNPFEVNVVNQSVQTGVALSEAFYSILYEMEDYSDGNPTHKALSDFIDSEQERFIQSGKTKRNGKTFVRRERYPHIPEDQKVNFYTFTDDDVVRLIAQRTKYEVDEQLSTIRNQFESAGYTRNGVPAPVASETPPVQQNTARPIQPTPMAGAVLPSKAEDGKKSNTLMSLLDL